MRGNDWLGLSAGVSVAALGVVGHFVVAWNPGPTPVPREATFLLRAMIVVGVAIVIAVAHEARRPRPDGA